MKLVTFTVFVLIALLGAPALAQDGGITWEGGATRAMNVGWNFVTATNCLAEYNGTIIYAPI
jgi:hypothetical protein